MWYQKYYQKESSRLHIWLGKNMESDIRKWIKSYKAPYMWEEIL
jgi:hypothetical protein